MRRSPARSGHASVSNAEPDPVAILVARLTGRELPPRADYIFAYNILYQMGIFANVAFITTNRNKTYESKEGAYESLLWMFPDLGSEEKIRLYKFVSERLVQDGSELRFDYDRTVRWAVMFWDVT
jgi:hypothetical protein